jgi:PKD repeat protein
VLQGATIQLDASTSQLQGGVPWTYTWDSDVGGSDDQTPQPATFTPDGNDASTVYDRPNPTQDFIYTTPGQSTAQLQLQSDFGTTTVTRPIDVLAPGPITADVSAAGGAVAGQPTALSASGTGVAAPDSIVDYHWDLGNGTSDDTAGPSETWTFPSAGTYTVTLTAIDQLGRTQTATTQVSVAPAPGLRPRPQPPPLQLRRRGRPTASRSRRSSAASRATPSCQRSSPARPATAPALERSRSSPPGR